MAYTLMKQEFYYEMVFLADMSQVAFLIEF